MGGHVARGTALLLLTMVVAGCVSTIQPPPRPPGVSEAQYARDLGYCQERAGITGEDSPNNLLLTRTLTGALMGAINQVPTLNPVAVAFGALQGGLNMMMATAQQMPSQAEQKMVMESCLANRGYQIAGPNS